MNAAFTEPAKPGPSNSITDVSGIMIGHAHDAQAMTGATVALFDPAMTASVDVRGGGPGTRETDLLDPSRLVHQIHALVFSGGSVYGLEAASAVTSWLGAQGRGYRLIHRPGAPVSPIVPAAILYDLANDGDKSWGETPPYADLGRQACEVASESFALGKVGAGYGARAGQVRGGIGSASLQTSDGYIVGALAAVNAFGSVYMPGSDVFWAWPLERDGEFGSARPDPGWSPEAGDFPSDTKIGAAAAGANTSLAMVALNVALDAGEAKRVAVMAQDGLARAIRPAHAAVDGDVVFCLANGERPMPEPKALTLSRLGSIAADCLARAVARGVYAARP